MCVWSHSKGGKGTVENNRAISLQLVEINSWLRAGKETMKASQKETTGIPG